MSKNLLLIVLFLSTFAYSQVDTSDVFVVGDDATEIIEDSMITKYVDVTSALKFDAGRIYSMVYLLSFEHLIRKSRWALEYEASFDLETEMFWYDLYTDNKFTDPENNVSDYDHSFNSSYMYVAGVGVALKKYFANDNSGIYGLYGGLKVKNRLGHVAVSNRSYFGQYEVREFIGYMNHFEVAATIGYCFYLWDFVLVDAFVGPSGILTKMKYASFEEDVFGTYWNPKNGIRFSPAIHFGLRLSCPKLDIRGINWTGIGWGYSPF